VSHIAQFTSYINGYLAVDSGGLVDERII